MDIGKKPQKFTVSHLDPGQFHPKGLRSYFDYRDLGISDATVGGAQVHVVKANQPCKEGGLGWHRHVLDFQFAYVLKGWQKIEVEGEGEVVLRAGSAWIQPPGIKHNVLGYSEDFEALEMILPADFQTEDVAKPTT